MTEQIVDSHVGITPGLLGGKPHIIGHRIKVVDVVVWHEILGKSADEICVEYELELAEVYAALAYYFGHRKEIDADIKEEKRVYEMLKKQNSSVLERKLDSQISE